MEAKQGLVDFWRERFGIKERELKAFLSVNRADFVPENLKEMAYEDRPLPILRGKTISQPTTVMLMTAALEIEAGMKVFEVGTGSGYQAAILSKMVGEKGKVFTTEIIPELIPYAKSNLDKAGISNVNITEEDGSRGMEKEGPFDRIILTAAAKEFPKELIEQLKEGGVIIGPIGSRDQQEMVRGVKEEGKLRMEFLGPYLFTPMYGKYGFEV